MINGDENSGLTLSQELMGVQIGTAAIKLVELGVKISLAGKLELDEEHQEEFQSTLHEILTISMQMAREGFADTLDELAETAPKTRADLKAIATFLRES